MKTFFLVLILFSLSLAARAQQKQGSWWMFGDNLTLNFNQQQMQIDTARVGSHQPIIANAAYSTISDAKGNLLFYNDGLKVSNRHRKMMPNGFLYTRFPAFGSLANLIVGRPGSNNEFYLFNVVGVGYPDSGTLTYNLIDMRLDSSRGDVVTAMKNVLLNPNSGEHLAVLLHSNNTDYWLVASSKNSDSLYTYPITSAGIGSPVITPLSFSLVSCIGSGLKSMMLGFLFISVVKHKI